MAMDFPRTRSEEFGRNLGSLRSDYRHLRLNDSSWTSEYTRSVKGECVRDREKEERYCRPKIRSKFVMMNIYIPHTLNRFSVCFNCVESFTVF